MMEDIKYIIESLLFVAEGPLTVERIRNVIAHVDTNTIKDALVELTKEYEDRKGGFFLSEVADGYQIRTRSEYKEYIKRLIQPPPVRISKASLETLAIIAYKQPLLRSDIEHIRGVDCGGVLRVLLERKLIRVLGRKEIPGKPLIYGTTKQFLEVFDLRNLKDLPSPKEIEELGAALQEKD
ncbi:SMC-Scp complex subunit ScpB [Thermodesulfobacteriota bacterium]